MKKKIKQYSFWTGLSAAVVILLTALSKAFGFEFQEEIVTDIIMAVCGVLVVFGVVNAPIKTNEEITGEQEATEEIKENTINQQDNENISNQENKLENIKKIKEKKDNKN